MFQKPSDHKTQQPSGAMPEMRAQDEELFAALGKSKKAKKRKLIRTIVILLIAFALILTVGVILLRRQVRERFAASASEVLSAQAEKGTISTVVSGSGMLTNVDTQVVSVPSGVEVTEILVAFGDAVSEGDLLAIVDQSSVRTVMSERQSELADLDSQITDARGDSVSSSVTAGVPGRVKILNAGAGTLVEDAMVEHGSLAVLSLDGYMAVDLKTDALEKGGAVTVRLSDGSTVSGSVEALVAGVATVLLTDDGPAYGEEVTVAGENGTEIGSGTLYIHNPLAVTGYAGTVNAVCVKPNQKVYANTTLFTLTDTSTSASYDALLRTRSETEETLLELLQLQRYGGLTAPVSGSVCAVADLEGADAGTVTDIVTLSPDVSMSVTISVDESDILSLELDQEAEVTVSSVSDETLTGVVTGIDKTDASGSYTATVTLDKQAGMLPGMTASVKVRIEGVDDAILIPVDALHQTSTGYYVYTAYDEEAQQYGGQVDVVPGLSNDDYVEIKSGLGEGDTVYYTEKQSFTNPFGGKNFGGMSGGSMPGGDMPSSGGMPDFGGGQPGGERPNRG